MKNTVGRVCLGVRLGAGQCKPHFPWQAISRPQLGTIRVHILRPAGLDWRFCKIIAQKGLRAYKELLWGYVRGGKKLLLWCRYWLGQDEKLTICIINSKPPRPTTSPPTHTHAHPHITHGFKRLELYIVNTVNSEHAFVKPFPDSFDC